MKEHPLYIILYTVVLCGVSALLLAAAHVAWQERIEANRSYARIHAMVDAAGLCEPTTARETVMELFAKRIEAAKEGEMELFRAKGDDGQLVATLVELEGQGRYGTIKGILAFAPDRQHIKRLRVYEQNETPGLGGRVGTLEWLSQFDDLPMVVNGQPGIGISAKVSAPNEVAAVTGASQTMFALSQSINTMIHRYLSGGAKISPLNLDVGPDAVTRATPGYPKGFKPPPGLREDKTKRPDFMVPEGVHIISLNKPVTSILEDEEPMRGSLSQITDGKKFSNEDDYVEMFPGELQWVQIDLEETMEIFCICVWHYYKNPIVYKDVIVQVSDDKDFENDVITLFNNDYDNSAGFGKGEDPPYRAAWWGELVDARSEDRMSGTRARYVRVYTNGDEAGDDTRFVEIGVYGR